MPHSLSINPKHVNYSKTERRMFDVIASFKEETPTDVIMKTWYDEVPPHGREIVIGIIRSLAKKIELNEERVELLKTKRDGPNFIKFRVRRRTKR